MRHWATDDLAADVPPPAAFDNYGVKPSLVRVEAQLVALNVVAASELEGEPPARSWLVRDLIPDRAVTLLGGDGGVGKSLLALQLAFAVATAADWIGMLPEVGPVLYVSAEDDRDEIHRRLIDILRSSDGVERADMAQLHLLPLAGMNAVLGASDGRGGIAATALWQALEAKIAELRPRLVILDNLEDVFAGNENARPEARQFVGLLRGAAIAHEMAVVLIAHPSLTGLANGTGTSGSTAWSNSVRSRLYLDRATSDEGLEPDPAMALLQIKKANYAPACGDLRLRWDAGRFRLDGHGTSAFDRIARDAKAEIVFLELLQRHSEQGRDVTVKPSRTYAPTVFARDPDANGIGAKFSSAR